MKKKSTSKKKKNKKLLEQLGALDVVFIIDATGSMSPYIQEAKNHAALIIEQIQAKFDLDIKIGLILYRDHPPQDFSFITESYDFSTIEEFNKALAPVTADGGGDRPEAVYDGINELFELSWREGSDRIVYLIGDSPPHTNCPCGLKPELLISLLKEHNIELNAHSIANYQDTTEAFKQFVNATGGAITVGDRPSCTTQFYTDGLTTRGAYYVENSRAFVKAADSCSFSINASMTTSDVVNIGTSAGLTAEDSIKTFNYLVKRGL